MVKFLPSHLVLKFGHNEVLEGSRESSFHLSGAFKLVPMLPLPKILQFVGIVSAQTPLHGQLAGHNFANLNSIKVYEN